MPPEVSEFVFGTLTPAALGLSAIALILTSFARGWIVSRFTVETLVAATANVAKLHEMRAEDWKVIAETERAARLAAEKRADILQEILTQLGIVGETTLKILSAIPVPPSGGNPTKVDT